MKRYEKPEMTVEEISKVDVIATSCWADGGGDAGFDPECPCDSE